MTEIDPTGPEITENAEQHPASARKNRGIRFSDLEWDEVKQAAQTSGITPAEFVRDKILDLIRSPTAPGNNAVPAHLAPLIERTFRYTYMLATKMRDEMTAAGDGEQLDELINEARELQQSLLGDPPN